jgi:hypothetical protein
MRMARGRAVLSGQYRSISAEMYHHGPGMIGYAGSLVFHRVVGSSSFLNAFGLSLLGKETLRCAQGDNLVGIYAYLPGEIQKSRYANYPVEGH